MPEAKLNSDAVGMPALSGSGWDNSHPLKYKCTFCNTYFKTDEERKKHQEEAHSDY